MIYSSRAWWVHLPRRIYRCVKAIQFATNICLNPRYPYGKPSVTDWALANSIKFRIKNIFVSTY